MIKSAAITLIKIYRVALSPLWPATCRFAPTCSEYALEAITKHGALKGAILGIIRIGKCHPGHRKDFTDPVPENFIWPFAWPGFIRYKRRQDHKNKSKNGAL